MKCRALTFRLLSILLLLALPALAQKTIHVPGDEPTIQQAINTAQNGDTVLVAPGTYNENIDFKGKSIEVTSESSTSGGAPNSFIMGSSGPTVIFQSNEPSGATLNGFTITHQSPGGQTPPGEGIVISGASPTISSNIVTENDGCGISIKNASSSPVIEGNEISWNFEGPSTDVPYCGAAYGISLDSVGSVEISNNTIQGNNTISPAGSGGGGGIVGSGGIKLTITNNAIFDNTSFDEDAGNSSDQGAAFADGGIAVFGVANLAIIQNLVYSNVLIGGNGIAGVIAGAADPGSQLPSGTVTVLNNTVVGNIGPNRVAEQFGVGGYPAQSIVENNVFESTDGSGAVYCDEGANVGFTLNDVIGGTSTNGCGGFNNISADPQFVDAKDDNFHLTAASPLIAAGDPSAPGVPTTDFDGLPRIVNGTISLGVYEYQPATANPPILTSSANPSYVGQPVTFTATVNVSAAESPATGTMNFRDGAALLGTGNVNSAGVAALSTSSLTAGNYSIYAAYSGGSELPAGITNAISQVVTTFPTTATLSASQSSIAYGQSITFTVAVQSPASSQPVNGGVDFYNGSDSIGIANVNDGTASFTTSSLGPGDYTITADFIRNQTFSNSVSNAVNVNVTSDFTISATPGTRSVSSGQSAKFTVTVASDSGFNQPVALTCSGLPAGASCSFSPVTLQNGVGSSQLVIEFASQDATIGSRNERHLFRRCGVVVPLLCALFLMPRGWHRRYFLAVLLLFALIPLVSCSAALLSLSPQSSYSIVVTGTSNGVGGALAHSTTITLEVEPHL